MIDNPDLPTDRLPRLNPFAFPSNTTFLFTLLIFAVLGSSAFIYDSLFFTFHAQEVLQSISHCQAIADQTFPQDDQARNDLFDACRAPDSQSEAIWTLTGIALLLTAALLAYWFLPDWKVWRSRLVRLRNEDAPELVSYLDRLCQEMGLRKPPDYSCAPLNGSISGLAFGRFGRYTLALNGGLIRQFTRDRGAFRAVALHELAHLRNGDVDKAYFSVALWPAFVVAALAPYAIGQLFRPANIGPLDAAYLASLLWRLTAMAMLVFLIYKALLRAREQYADVRAVSVEGPEGSLDRILAALPNPQLPAWRRLFLAHPQPEDRRRTIVDPEQIFHTHFWEAFAAGAVAMIAFADIYQLLSYLLVGMTKLPWGLTRGEVATYGAGLIFTPPAAGLVAAAVWRESLTSRLGGPSPSHYLTRLGFGLALGVAAGQIISIQNSLDTGGGFLFDGLIFNLIWMLLLLISLLFLVHWAANAASPWIDVLIYSATPRLIYTGLFMTGLVMWLLSGPLFLLYTLGQQIVKIGEGLLAALSFGLLAGFIVSATYAHTIVGFISLWAYPLASLAWRKAARGRTVASWLYLDDLPGTLLQAETHRLRSIPAMLIGLSGGILWCGFIFILYLIAGDRLPAFTQENADQLSTILYSAFAFAGLAQTFFAFVAASWLSGYRVVHGLLAAFAAGCTMTAGLMGVQLLMGGAVSLANAWVFFSNVIGMGALFSLLMLGVLSTLIEWGSQWIARK